MLKLLANGPNTKIKGGTVLKEKVKRSKLNEFSFRNRYSVYLMLFPFLSLFVLFTILPIITSVILSFFNFDMVSIPEFAGLDNYVRMLFDDDIFPIVAKNTLFFAIITGPLGFIIAFVLAWFINEFNPMVRTLLTFMFYAPSLVGNAYYIWQVAFSSDSYGYVNNILISLGLITEPILWLQNADYVMMIIIIVQLWQNMGISFLSNIAGLQNISPELYEAGAVDGIKNRWQELWYITLPAMKNMLLFSAVMQIQASFSAGAISTAMAGYPSVEYAADMIVQYMSDVGTTKFEMGYASSLSVVLFAMMFAARMLIGKILGTKKGGNS